jgi:CNT family concentrative nucleoside transporter
VSVFQSILGIFTFILIPYLLSHYKKDISKKFILVGIVAQLLLAVLFLKVPLISSLLLKLNALVGVLQRSTAKSAQYMLGYLAGGPAPFEAIAPENAFIIAFQVLPLILVISALSALLFHFGILTWVVSLFSGVLRKAFNISGPLGFGAASTVFLGTIEAPLIVRPYLSKLSKAELLALIVCSMSTIAGTVIVLYASVLERSLPNALTHLLTASIISVPAALMLSHIIIPTGPSSDTVFSLEKSNKTWVEVFLDSIHDGVNMIISIAAIIIVLFAFIHLIDAFLGIFNSNITVGFLLSQVLRPIMWLVGFDWDKAIVAADLMGTKIVLNEFVSYLKLAEVSQFSPREKLIAVYSMCGFANFASCGIIIAGLTTIIPVRRKEVVELTMISLLLGNLATLMTGSVVNLVSYF